MTRVGARAESGFVMVGTFSVTSCRALRRLQSLIRSCRGCVPSRTLAASPRDQPRLTTPSVVVRERRRRRVIRSRR